MKRSPSAHEVGLLRDALVESFKPLLLCQLNGACVHLVTCPIPGLGTYVVHAERRHPEGHTGHVITVTWSGKVSLARPGSPFKAVLVCGEFASTKPPVGAYAPFVSHGFCDVAQIEFRSASMIPQLLEHLSVNATFLLGIRVVPAAANCSDFPYHPGAMLRRAHLGAAA